MESSFIPNLNPAIGRTSTPWSPRSKKPNECGRGLSAPTCCEYVLARRSAFDVRRSAFSLQSAIQRADEEESCRDPSPSVASWTFRLFNTQRSTLNAQRSIQTVECWALDACRAVALRRRVERLPRRSARAEAGWTFALFWRVKGAWWPSRSSKPLLIRQLPDQGRFDSYPLRFFYARGMGFQPMFHRQDADATSSKGGEGMSRDQIRRLTSLSSCAG
jgi:hypothetical protein